MRTITEAVSAIPRLDVQAPLVFTRIAHAMPVAPQRTFAETGILSGQKKGRVGVGSGLWGKHSFWEEGLLKFEVAFLHVALLVEGGGQWNPASGTAPNAYSASLI